MGMILNIETATTNCSVCVAKDGEILAIKENDTPNYSHSEQLHIFIEEVLQQASVAFNELNAIAVSKGPGSYTGLRIGVSAAKGLCFSLDVPLISIPTLESMVHQTMPVTADFMIPVLDARRMEVYAAVFDSNFDEIRETRAEVIDDSSFAEYIQKGSVLLVGSGAEKCRELFQERLSYQPSIVPSSREMAPLSFRKFKKQQFEDVAYFEPYYLKDFVLATKKKS